MKIDRLRSLIVAVLTLLFISCQAAEKTTVLIVGDSLSSGYGLEFGQGWVELLSEDFNRRGMEIDIVNDSISGDTTAGGAARLPAALEKTRPDWVIIELGGNDGLRGGSLSAMQENLMEMVRSSLALGAKPILLGVKLPPNYGRNYTSGFERVYQEVAEKTGTPLLPFFIRGIENDPAMFQSDRIHPNALAQPVIMQNVRAFLADIL